MQKEYFFGYLTQSRYIVSHLYIYTFIYSCLLLFIKVNTPHRTSTANTLLGINGTDNYPYLTVIKDHERSFITSQMSHTSVFSEQYNNYFNTRCFMHLYNSTHTCLQTTKFQ